MIFLGYEISYYLKLVIIISYYMKLVIIISYSMKLVSDPFLLL
jgi:hypothetical protein